VLGKAHETYGEDLISKYHGFSLDA
jgi:hypothetical protein